MEFTGKKGENRKLSFPLTRYSYIATATVLVLEWIPVSNFSWEFYDDFKQNKNVICL